MKLFPLLSFFFATIVFSTTVESRLSKIKPDTCACYVPTHRRLTLTTILSRTQRSRPVEVSLSPPTLPIPAKPTSNNITKDNSSTSSTPQKMPSAPAWVLTVEDLITAIFRIVVTILAFFNVSITWRIRGEYPSTTAHKEMSAQSNTSDSEPRSSPRSGEECMGGREV